MKGLSDEKAFEETTTSVADNADVATSLRSAKKEKLKSLNKKERSKEKESPSKRKKKQRKNKSKNAKEKCDKDGKNYKKEKKKSRKNEDMCKEICRECKMKKKKQLNNRKVKKRKAREAKKNKVGRKSKQSSAVAVSGKCNNITCLNDMLEVLKIDKDMVQNYIQQKKRLDARLTLSGLFEAKSTLSI